MKTLKTLLLTTVGVLGSLVSTRVEAQTLTFGPKIGLNFATFTAPHSDPRMGPAGGVSFVYSHHEHFGFSGDLLYTYKGARFVNTMADGSQLVYNTQLSYVELPIMAIYYFRPKTHFRPKLAVGPSFSFLVDGEQQVKFKPVTGESTETESDIDNFKKFDFGVVAETGFNYEVWDMTWLNVDLRYTLGLSNIAKTGDEIKNRNFGILVGMAFPICRGDEKKAE